MNISIYQHVIPLMHTIKRNRSHLKIQELTSTMSVASGVPIIAICYFYGQLYGYTPELQDQINNLIKFYNYGKVTGYEEILPEVSE